PMVKPPTASATSAGRAVRREGGVAMGRVSGSSGTVRSISYRFEATVGDTGDELRGTRTAYSCDTHTREAASSPRSATRSAGSGSPHAQATATVPANSRRVVT